MAGIKIRALPVAPSAQLTDVFPVSQLPGPVTYQESLQQVLTLFQTQGQALTSTNDTNVTITLGGSPTNALLNASSITLGWTGILGVTRGGTGLGSFSQGDMIYANAANTLTALSKNTTATRYLSNTGTSNNPAWAQVNLSNGVTNNLPVTNLNSGTGASATTFWRGDGTWGTPAGTGVSSTTGTANQVLVNGTSATPQTGAITLTTPQDIATTSNPTFASLKLTATNSLLDTNGATWIAQGDSFGTPAVNYITIFNAATGHNPVIEASGSDTNVDLGFQTQGTGNIRLASANTTTPIGFLTGTSYQHGTNFSFANTAVIRTVTYPDADFTIAGTSLALGGTNNALVASNGGIVWSDASKLNILSGTATANLPLLSGSTATPSWGAFALSLGGALTTAGAHTLSGAFASTFTFTNTTSVTFPTSGTLATTSQIPTGAALTKTDDTNVTLTLGGSPTTALVNAASLTLGWTGQLGLTRGGTNASLTASNGGIIYSTASAMAVLSGTATANQVLLSGSSTTPAWSTATYPATTTINQLLYSNAANTITGLATGNSAVLITSSGGVPSLSTTLPSGIAATNMNLTTPTLGAASATSLTFSSTTGIVGTTTNDNAASGSVGQFVSSVVTSGSPTSISSATATDLTSISLGAGDWDVFGNINFRAAAGTTVTYLICWLSSSSASIPDPSLYSSFVYGTATVPALASQGLVAPSMRFSLSTTTTIYITGYTVFGVSTMAMCGGIYARRRR